MAAKSTTRVVLITGANQGIGFEIAKSLSALAGYYVLLGSRDMQRGISAAKQLEGQASVVEPIAIDVTSDESIASAVEKIASQFGRLDVLVNNAGISIDGEDDLKGPALRKAYEEIFAVNTFGAAVTTESFVPLLEASSEARVVFVSTIMGSFDRRSMYPATLPVYRSSKTALNMLMLHYADKYKEKGWKVNAICPGYCATNLNAFAGFDTPASGAAGAVHLVTLGNDGETGTFSEKAGLVDW